MLFSQARLLDTPSPGRAAGRDPVRKPLSARDFEWFLERERCLADRGTRLFTLLVVHRLRGSPAGLVRLGLRLRERLRSTDVVGHLDPDRLGAILTDTGPAGAHVVADWVDRAAASVGLRTERRTYIYPRVPRTGIPSHRGSTSASDDPPGEDRHPDPPRRRLARARRVARATKPTHGLEFMEDLWPRLSHPNPVWKRTLDIVLSALALLVLLPVFALVAIAIRLDSPGPVFFSQPRAGRGGRPFPFYKFRSMFADAERRKAEIQGLNEQDGPVFKVRDDPRITRVGRVLRRWSLDELPQIWNVLKGDFSLVGPRPPTLDEVEKYERWQRRRLSVAGGITGPWQVSGRSEIGFLPWMRMDLRYIARRGMWLDFVLLARSIPAVLSGRGAY